jgi:hypothetical protein
MSEEKNTTKEFPTAEDFCLNIALYASYNKSRDFDNELSYYKYILEQYENFSNKLSLPDTFVSFDRIES